MGAVEREGMTLVPLKLYFNEKGRAKVELALARGKKLHDKRETEKKRSWEASSAGEPSRRELKVRPSFCPSHPGNTARVAQCLRTACSPGLTNA